MTKNLDKIREAELMYLRGMSCDDIARHMKLSLSKINRWRTDNNWVEKRMELLENPRSVAEILRERLRELVASVTTAGGITVVQLDEISKLTRLIKEIAGEGYQLLAATIEVMRLYLDFVRSHSAEDFEVVFRYSGEFFREILRRERGGRSEFTQEEVNAKGV